jgi:membrane-associated PAP2 superfamily phosphatase
VSKPDFWMRHAWLPGSAFAVFAVVAATTALDVEFARSWAFDPDAGRFIGAGPGEWWAKGLIHTWGGGLIRATGLVALLVVGLSYGWSGLASLRRPLGYIVLAAASAVIINGALKATTNVDCPWSLSIFGGDRPYVHLLGDRPDDLPRGRCFPGGHSGSGFALLPLYFLWRGRSRRLAALGLAAGLLVGGVFAFGQQARGAHFLSHDVWSAAIAWACGLAVYVALFRCNVWSPMRRVAPASHWHSAGTDCRGHRRSSRRPGGHNYRGNSPVPSARHPQ